MQELLDLLHSSGFKTYIVLRGDAASSGPGREDIRGTSDQVIGSGVRTKLEVRKGAATLVRRRSSRCWRTGPADRAQLQGDRAPPHRSVWKLRRRHRNDAVDRRRGGRHLVLLVHHTNGGNEFAYDRKSMFGRLDRGLDMARKSKWTIADMTKDWNRFFAKTGK